jgi:hypothetical protein
MSVFKPDIFYLLLGFVHIYLYPVLKAIVNIVYFKYINKIWPKDVNTSFGTDTCTLSVHSFVRVDISEASVSERKSSHCYSPLGWQMVRKFFRIYSILSRKLLRVHESWRAHVSERFNSH